MKVVKLIAVRMKARARYKENCRQLEAMTDRQLQDIGITRGEIRSVLKTAR